MTIVDLQLLKDLKELSDRLDVVAKLCERIMERENKKGDQSDEQRRDSVGE